MIVLYGCTEDKAVVRCEMPLAQVLHEGIDHCRVDPFEPHPIVATIAGRRLLFSPIRRSWVCVNAGGRNYGILWMGENKRVFADIGTLDLDGIAETLMTCNVAEFKPYEGSFQDLLAELVDGSMYYSMRVSQVQVTGTKLQISGSSAFAPVFDGSLFEDATVKITTGPKIDWILKQLSPFHPRAEWKCLTKLLLGEQVDLVDVMVHANRLDIVTWAESLHLTTEALDSGKVVRVEHDGCLYDIRIPRWQSGTARSYFSTQMLCCFEPNFVRASQIALYDVSQRQRRVVDSDAFRTRALDVLHLTLAERIRAKDMTDAAKRGETDLVPAFRFDDEFDLVSYETLDQSNPELMALHRDPFPMDLALKALENSMTVVHAGELVEDSVKPATRGCLDPTLEKTRRFARTIGGN